MNTRALLVAVLLSFSLSTPGIGLSQPKEQVGTVNFPNSCSPAVQETFQRGVAMLVIEQNVERGLALADRAYVLEKGRVALHGPPAAIRDDPHLLALYVGPTAE